MWTSLGNESCCGFTGHWITNDWRILSVVLAIVVECDFAQNVAELYKRFVNDWDIHVTTKVKAYIPVIDNAPNIVSAVNQTFHA